MPESSSTLRMETKLDVLTALLGGAPARERLGDDAGWLDGPDAWLTPGAGGVEPSGATLRQLTREIAVLKLRLLRGLLRRLATDEHIDERMAASEVLGVWQPLPAAPIPARWQVEIELALGERTLGMPMAPGGTAGPDGRAELGLVMATVLLANDACPANSVEEQLRALAHRFADELPRAGTDAATFAATVLASSPFAAPANLLHLDAHRQRLTGPPLPAGPWYAVLGEALQLVAPAPAATTRARTNLATVLPALTQRLEAFDRALRIEAFGAEARREDLAALLRARQQG